MSRLNIEREDRVLRLTLNHPEKRNALDEALSSDLVRVLYDAGKDKGVGCVLLAGEGDTFCAGMDLDDALAPDAEERTSIHESLFTFGLRFHKPIVAAVQGAALGGGVGLLANCHVVVAAQGTKFGLTEIRLGMWPFVIWRAVVQALGERRATELALTGRIFGVNEALQYGLIQEVAQPVELDDRATATARLLSQGSQETMRRGLDFVQQSRGLRWEEAGKLAREMRAKTFHSGDFLEGARAFRERRKAVWPSLR